jgi:hypothetical protein
MAKKTKKSQTKKHVTYNKKMFLCANSIRSMAAIHTKIKDDGIAILRISDCNNSIRIWNNLNNKIEVEEMIVKVSNLMAVLNEFGEELKLKLPTYIK